MQVNKNAVFKRWFHLLREKSCPKLPGPLWKMNCPLLLNHERTVIIYIILESRVSLDTLRPDYCQTGWTKKSLKQNVSDKVKHA